MGSEPGSELVNGTKYSSVSTTLAIGGVELPNRIVFSAWQVNYANMDGTVSDKLMNFYTAIADWGCGCSTDCRRSDMTSRYMIQHERRNR
ncbi:MAG: hypothetical protein U9N43_06555 [Euryarchaeota archaeon]|nr:hypothetical protein [Euryarchaeota archaeon]